MKDAMERRRNRKSKGEKIVPDYSYKSFAETLTQHLVNSNEELKIFNDSCIAQEELECGVISTKDGNKYYTKGREASYHDLMNSGGVTEECFINIKSRLSCIDWERTDRQPTICNHCEQLVIRNEGHFIQTVGREIKGHNI